MVSTVRRLSAVLRRTVFRAGPDPTYADGDDASWMSVDWPAMTRRIQVDGQPITFVDTGGDHKPVLLLLHGLGNRWQHWLLTIPALMATHRCIAPDLPGFGDSPLPDGEVSIRRWAALVDGLCHEVGVERAAVVGSSMGGFIGAELALSFPTRVERLVLVSAAGLSIQSVPRAPLLALAWCVSRLGPSVVGFYRRVITRPRLRRLFLGLGVRYPERLSLPLTWQLVQGFGKPGFRPAVAALVGYSVRERMGEIAVPSLIVWGEDDLLVPVADSVVFEQMLGGPSRRVVLEETGHSPMLERPSRFNEVLLAFLAGEGEPAAGVAGVHAGRSSAT